MAWLWKLLNVKQDYDTVVAYSFQESEYGNHDKRVYPTEKSPAQRNKPCKVEILAHIEMLVECRQNWVIVGAEVEIEACGSAVGNGIGHLGCHGHILQECGIILDYSAVEVGAAEGLACHNHAGKELVLEGHPPHTSVQALVPVVG